MAREDGACQQRGFQESRLQGTIAGVATKQLGYGVESVRAWVN
jgi:transposase